MKFLTKFFNNTSNNTSNKIFNKPNKTSEAIFNTLFRRIHGKRYGNTSNKTSHAMFNKLSTIIDLSYNSLFTSSIFIEVYKKISSLRQFYKDKVASAHQNVLKKYRVKRGFSGGLIHSKILRKTPSKHSAKNLAKMVLCYLPCLFFFASCKAIMNIGEYSRWRVEYKYTTSILTNPAGDDKGIYVAVTNVSGQVFDLDIENAVKTNLINKGFYIENNPQIAKYRLIANIRGFRKINLEDYKSIEEYWNGEVGDTMASLDMSRRKSSAYIEKEMLQYSNYNKSDETKLRLEYSEKEGKASSENSTIGQIIEAYKNFDISGIILGSTIGFVTAKPENVILGGVYGGFLFEIAARSTNPQMYLMIIDLEVSEPRCAIYSSNVNSIGKNSNAKLNQFCANITEFDKQIYKQDDNTYRKVEFSRDNEYITYRTTIFGTSAKIFATKSSSKLHLSLPLPQILSASVR